VALIPHFIRQRRFIHTCVMKIEISIIPYTRRQTFSCKDTYSKWLGKVVGVGQLDVLVSFF